MNQKVRDEGQEEAVHLWNRFCSLVASGMDDRGLSTTWVANEAGIHLSTVHRITEGKRPEPPEKFVSMIRVANAIGLKFTITGKIA